MQCGGKGSSVPYKTCAVQKGGKKDLERSRAGVARGFNPKHSEGGSRQISAWSTKLVPEQVRLLHSETLSRKTKQNNNRKIKERLENGPVVT